MINKYCYVVKFKTPCVKMSDLKPYIFITTLHTHMIICTYIVPIHMFYHNNDDELMR